MAIDPTRALNLYNSYSTGLADLQDEENRTRINYQSALDSIRKRRRQDIGQLSNTMADRGLTHSGARLKTELDLNEGYNDMEANLGRESSDAISRLARRKLQEEANYNFQRSLI